LNRFDVAAERFELFAGRFRQRFHRSITPGRNGTMAGYRRPDTYDRNPGGQKYTHDPANPYSRSVNSTNVVLEDRNGGWAGGW
jgi:hypothetical protein